MVPACSPLLENTPHILTTVNTRTSWTASVKHEARCLFLSDVAIQSFENVVKIKYLGTTVTNQNYIHTEGVEILLCVYAQAR
jgi:hypothetical protein